MHTVWRLMHKLQQQRKEETPADTSQLCMSTDAGLTLVPLNVTIERYLTSRHPSLFHTRTSELTCSEWPTKSSQIGLGKSSLSSLSSLSASLWLQTSYGPLTPPWSECTDLSAKWYVVLLLPRVSDVLSPLRRSLCFTQLQREIWGRAAWLSAALLSRFLSLSLSLSL